jgi:hypothetical protein
MQQGLSLSPWGRDILYSSFLVLQARHIRNATELEAANFGRNILGSPFFLQQARSVCNTTNSKHPVSSYIFKSYCLYVQVGRQVEHLI